MGIEQRQQKLHEFRYTAAQQKAIELIGSGATDIMLFGGSRSGKTFVFTSLICTIAQYVEGIRIAILRRHLKDVRESVFMDSFPKAMRLRLGWSRERINRCFNKNDMVFRNPNGSEIWFTGLEDKERVDKILGKEFGLIYFNEVSQIPYSSIEVAKTRLAQKVPGWQNKCFYDCNPPSKSHWAYKIFVLKQNPITNALLINPDDYVSMKMNPMDNKENISADYLEKQLGALTGKNRQRFLYGEWTDDTENALWRQGSMIDQYRVTAPPDKLDRIVIGVDPAMTSVDVSNYTGIIVCGKRWNYDEQRFHYYILEDASIQGSPLAWAQQVYNCYCKHNADRIVAEVNQGGDLVRLTLDRVCNNLPVTTVRATRNKVIRAEPIAALYEKGVVHHVGMFEALETEMCSYVGPTKDSSPDRMDALVWAMSELSGVAMSKTHSFSMV